MTESNMKKPNSRQKVWMGSAYGISLHVFSTTLCMLFSAAEHQYIPGPTLVITILIVWSFLK
jgi:hypothetical protein